MNAPVLTYVSTFSAEPRFKDLDSVRLLRDITSDTRAVFAAGCVGTIVGTWADGAAYEVEFASDYGGLATVGAEDLEPDPKSK